MADDGTRGGVEVGPSPPRWRTAGEWKQADSWVVVTAEGPDVVVLGNQDDWLCGARRSASMPLRLNFLVHARGFKKCAYMLNFSDSIGTADWTKRKIAYR